MSFVELNCAQLTPLYNTAEVPHSPTKTGTSLDQIAEGPATDQNELKATIVDDGGPLSTEQSGLTEQIVTTTDNGGPLSTDQSGLTEQTMATTDEGGPLSTDQSEPVMTTGDKSGPLAVPDQTKQVTTISLADCTPPLEDHEMLNSVVLHHSSIFALHGIYSCGFRYTPCEYR